MIIQKLIPCPTFWACIGTASGNQDVEHPNKTRGYYSKYIYIIEGGGSTTNGTTTIQLTEGQLHDLSEHKGTNTTVTVGNNQSTWVAFNPKEPDSDFTVNVHNDNQTITGECIIYCIKDKIQVNGTDVKNDCFVRVAENTSVNVTASSLYAIVRT